MKKETPAHTFLKKENFFFPMISFIVSLCAVFLIVSLPGELGAVLIAINIIIIWCCLLIPISFLYSSKTLKSSEKRVFYTLLNSFVACLPCIILARIMIPSRLWLQYALIYMLVIFAWCEIWGLIGLIGKRSTSNNKLSNITNDKIYLYVLYPIIAFVLSFCIECIAFIPKSNFYNLIVNTVLLVWILLFMPLTSFLYSKIILKNSSNKIAYTFLNSLAICLSYLFLLFLELHSYWFALGVFTWCEIWGLIGLIGKRDKNDKNKDEIPSEQ